MSKARNLADLLDVSGDVSTAALDNVPPNTALVDSSDNTVLDTSSGVLSANGQIVTGADGISMQDNERLYVGNADDLQIWHDGSNSYIQDVNTGDLRIKGADVVIQQSNGENQIASQSGGSVSLSHNGSTKLATTSTGVSVTGVTNTNELVTNSSGIGVYVYNGGNIRVHNVGNTYAADIYTDGRPTGSVSKGVDGIVWMNEFHNRSQHCTYDRSWNDYPSITVHNTTTHGPQSEFRIHGAPGDNGGDISTATRCDGGFITGSDERRKRNIESITDALSVVKQLDGKRFNVINSEGDIEEQLSHDASGKKLGFIAQEALNVIPEAVKYYEEADTANENGWASAYSIDYSSVVALLTNAIKEQQVIIDDLKARVEALEG